MSLLLVIDGLVGCLRVSLVFGVAFLLLYLAFQFLVQKLKIQFIFVFFIRFFVFGS